MCIRDRCNNAFIFPGIGLGVIAPGASRITDEMLMSASETLAQYSPLVLNGEGLVLPELKDIQKVSRACLLYTSSVPPCLMVILTMSASFK